MSIHTKIVCTIGPAVNKAEKIKALIDAGMDVARLNFSHGTHEEHGRVIDLLRQAREEAKRPIAIMLDTKGPEIRLGKFKNGQVTLKEGSYIWLIRESIEGDETQISLMPSVVLDVLKEGMVVLLDDGYILTQVVEVAPQGVRVKIIHGGVVKSSKGVNIPDADADLPVMTEKDIEDIRFGCERDIDLIAASFIRSAEHVMEIKKLLESEGKKAISVIAKIENRLGVKNFDSILQVADGIMVARGDLGVELPLYEVPRLQKMMIRKCYLVGKPAVTATQMLESMIVNPRPTRAEASDVANAIYDSSSAVMLSGETAVGSYPLQAVTVMKAIIEETERDFNYYDFFQKSIQRVFHDVPSSVAQSSIKTAYSANAKAIFAFTTSGSTARLLSRLRPEMPIFALTSNEKVYHQLALCWGVIPVLSHEAKNIEEAFKITSDFALERQLLKHGDLVVITAGTPFGCPGTTNMIIIDCIGDVLVKAAGGYGSRIQGKISLIFFADQYKDYVVKDKIIVIKECNESYLPLLKQAKGVILQNSPEDQSSTSYLKKMAESLSLSAIWDAAQAFSVLREEQLITLDPTQRAIYKGALS